MTEGATFAALQATLPDLYRRQFADPLQPRTVIDQYFAPDSITGNLGLNPTISNRGGVDAFLSSANTADVLAGQNAVTACSGGPSAGCSDAQALAGRASTFST